MSKSSKCTHADNDYCIYCSKHFAEPLTKLEAHKHGYDCGFDDGFEEAIRLLSTKEANEFSRQFYKVNGFYPDMGYIADWLESTKNDAQGS